MLRKKMLLVGSLFFLVIIFFLPFFATADLEFDEDEILKNASRLGTNDPASIAYDIVNWALVFLGIITLIMVIIAGFLWMFAAGEEEKIKKAQDILKGALIGLILVLASYGIAQYVFNRLMEIASSDPGATVFDQVDSGEIDIGEDSHGEYSPPTY